MAAQPREIQRHIRGLYNCPVGELKTRIGWIDRNFGSLMGLNPTPQAKAAQLVKGKSTTTTTTTTKGKPSKSGGSKKKPPTASMESANA